MSGKSTAAVSAAKSSLNADRSGLLQRKCDCGNAAGLTGKCSGCQSKRLTKQPDSVAQTGSAPVLHDLIQPKLTVGEPGDKYEQEADRIADLVIRMPEPSVQRQMEPEQDEAEGMVQRQIATQITPLVQRQVLPGMEEEEEEVIQTKAADNQAAPLAPTRESSEVPSTVHEVLRSPSQPLDLETRAFMEPRFGHDFSHVHVHTDAKAAKSALAINALAYTMGRDLVFGAGQYLPETTTGKKLIAHELAHSVQQGKSPPNVQQTPAVHSSINISGCAPDMVARKMDFAALKDEINKSTLQNNVMQSEVVGHGAESPKIPAPTKGAKPTRVATAQDNVPTDSKLPIEAFFFPSPLQNNTRRALVIGGIHGTEKPSVEIADRMVAELKKPDVSKTLFFHTLIIPRVNPGGIQDNSRCNRQEVDLNRNFFAPAKGSKQCEIALPIKRAGKANCTCAGEKQNIAPEQPETALIKKVVQEFQPDQILSLHAIEKAGKAGIFADPITDKASTDLTLKLAETLPKKLRQGNKGLKVGYEGGSTGGVSLGAWAPTAVTGKTTTVITLEVPEDRTLGSKPDFSGTRTVETYLRPSLGFVQAPETLINPEDENLIKDIKSLSSPMLKLFLTGQDEALAKKIEQRVLSRIADLNALLNRDNGERTKQKLKQLPALTQVSMFRAFGIATEKGKLTGMEKGGQGRIVFDKFFLTGSMSDGWDSLPQAFWFDKKNPKKGSCTITDPKKRAKDCSVDRTKWLAESANKRLKIILRFSAVPGASRHNWGTEVDFNSTTSEDWQSGGTFNELGVWLQANAYKAGFAQVYISGRKGGHSDEPWHWTYMPLAVPLLDMYRKNIATDKDVVPPIIQFFNDRAKASGETVPGDFETAIKAINIMEFVTDIAPGL